MIILVAVEVGVATTVEREVEAELMKVATSRVVLEAAAEADETALEEDAGADAEIKEDAAEDAASEVDAARVDEAALEAEVEVEAEALADTLGDADAEAEEVELVPLADIATSTPVCINFSPSRQSKM